MLVVWTLVLAALLALIMRYLQHKKYKLPPGPRGLPFFGNVFQLDKDKPQDTITKWSDEYGDVFKIKLFGRQTVVLNGFEAIHQGLVSKANDFAGRVPSLRVQTFLCNCPNIGGSTFDSQWIFRKKIAMQTLKMYGNNLQNLEMISMDVIGDMLEELKLASTKGPLDIYPIYHKCITRIITSVLYGEKVDEMSVKTIHDCVDEAFILLQPTGLNILLDIFPWLRFFPNEMYRKLRAAATKARVLMTKKIDERRARHEPNNPKCFIDGMLDHQRRCAEKQSEKQLSDSEIYGVNSDLLMAGTWTTATTLNALIAIVVNKPEIQQRMSNEINTVLGARAPTLADRKSLHYIEAAILEVLRYSSIVPLNLPHFTTVDTSVNGFDIPKDREVLFNLWKLHHNPEYWDQPWEFKPERYLDKDGALVSADHVTRKRLFAFGASRRVCPGETLARNRLFLMVTSLLQHFEFLPAGPDEIPQHDPRDYKPSLGLEPYKYRITLVPRK